MAGKRSLLKRILKWAAIVLLVIVALVVAAGLYIRSQMPSHTDPGKAPAAVKASGDEVVDAMRRGLEYLRIHQEEDGHFVAGRLSPKPAFTALVVEAFLASPDKYSVKDDEFLSKAVDAIIAEQKDSGAIFTEIPGMSFSSYSTSVVLLALNTIKDKDYSQVISKAAAYLKDDQHPKGSVNEGGFGYGKESRADLSNTCAILEALEQSGIPKDDPVWENAQTFITKCQNRSESNPAEWAGDDGGFIYCPSGLKKGQVGRNGRPRTASYGTMSYAGLVSFLFANVGKDDPRVKSAFAWVQKNYNLTEHVGRKKAGLFYYYRIMAKALQRYGERYVETPDGVKHDWAKELADQIISLQRPDGSWVNDNRAYLENDPILVTSYMVRTLALCNEEIRKAKNSPAETEE